MWLTLCRIWTISKAQEMTLWSCTRRLQRRIRSISEQNSRISSQPSVEAKSVACCKDWTANLRSMLVGTDTVRTSTAKALASWWSSSLRTLASKSQWILHRSVRLNSLLRVVINRILSLMLTYPKTLAVNRIAGLRAQIRSQTRKVNGSPKDSLARKSLQLMTSLKHQNSRLTSEVIIPPSNSLETVASNRQRIWSIKMNIKTS